MNNMEPLPSYSLRMEQMASLNYSALMNPYADQSSSIHMLCPVQAGLNDDSLIFGTHYNAGSPTLDIHNTPAHSSAHLQGQICSAPFFAQSGPYVHTYVNNFGAEMSGATHYLPNESSVMGITEVDHSKLCESSHASPSSAASPTSSSPLNFSYTPPSAAGGEWDDDEATPHQRLEQLRLSSCCSRGCLVRLMDETTVPFLKDIQRMDKRLRELYILVLLQQCREHGSQVSRKKQTRQRQRDKYNYMINPIGYICHDAFIQLFGVTKGYLDALQSYLRQQNSVIPRVHAAGKDDTQLPRAPWRTRKRRATSNPTSSVFKHSSSVSPVHASTTPDDESPHEFKLEDLLHVQ